MRALSARLSEPFAASQASISGIRCSRTESRNAISACQGHEDGDLRQSVQAIIKRSAAQALLLTLPPSIPALADELSNSSAA
jgi:hypothetical protein